MFLITWFLILRFLQLICDFIASFIHVHSLSSLFWNISSFITRSLLECIMLWYNMSFLYATLHESMNHILNSMSISSYMVLIYYSFYVFQHHLTLWHCLPPGSFFRLVVSIVLYCRLLLVHILILLFLPLFLPSLRLCFSHTCTLSRFIWFSVGQLSSPLVSSSSIQQFLN